MTAAALADELLQMILATSLTISEHQFVSSSPTTFGENDVVSSASVLLVCKKWLRVATPLLYETVIIRSTGQACSLARVLGCHPGFAMYVKKVRLEGSYAYLEAILPKCRNLVTLVLLLHIYADADTSGLCPSLSLINPTEVILHDPSKMNNAKVRRVLVALCNAIPGWTKLTSFEYPYGQGEGYPPLDASSTISRSDCIVDALAKSKSLQTFYSPLSQLAGTQWRRLASASSVAFKFRCQSLKYLDLERLMTFAREKSDSTAAITNSIEFIETSKAYSTPKTTCSAPRPLTQSFRFDTIPDNIWNRIISFATLPAYPNPPEDCDHYFTEPSRKINAKRQAFSLTCKKFERLVRPILSSFPLFPSVSSLKQFTDMVVKAPHLGRQVRVLYLLPIWSTPQMHRATEAHLLRLIPYLTSLLLFESKSEAFGGFSIEIITSLSKAAGDTLRSLKGSYYNHSQPFSLTTLASFKQLRTLDFPNFHMATHINLSLGLDSFPYLRKIRIEGTGKLFDALCAARLPALRSLIFQYAPPGSIGKLLHVSGSTIQALHFAGFNNVSEILRLAPNLLYLELDIFRDNAKGSLALYEALSEPAGHEKLEILTFEDFLGPASGEKEQNNVVKTIFNCLDLMKFPSLKKIRFPAYTWPLEERSISRQLLPKNAVQVKENYGIHITDSSEKPWRPRAQRRR